MHFSEIIKLQLGIRRHILLINYFGKMLGYPMFLFGFKQHVKICFSHKVSKPRKNTFELVGTVLNVITNTGPLGRWVFMNKGLNAFFTVFPLIVSFHQ